MVSFTLALLLTAVTFSLGVNALTIPRSNLQSVPGSFSPRAFNSRPSNGDHSIELTPLPKSNGLGFNPEGNDRKISKSPGLGGLNPLKHRKSVTHSKEIELAPLGDSQDRRGQRVAAAKDTSHMWTRRGFGASLSKFIGELVQSVRKKIAEVNWNGNTMGTEGVSQENPSPVGSGGNTAELSDQM